jgi:hypothetical protein
MTLKTSKSIALRSHRNGLGSLTRRITFYTGKAAKYSKEGAAGRYRRYARLMAYKAEMTRRIEDDFRRGGLGI